MMIIAVTLTNVTASHSTPTKGKYSNITTLNIAPSKVTSANLITTKTTKITPINYCPTYECYTH